MSSNNVQCLNECLYSHKLCIVYREDKYSIYTQIIKYCTCAETKYLS